MRKDLEGKERTLGKDHEKTMISAFNLACSLAKMDVTLPEAEALARRVVSGWTSSGNQYVDRGVRLLLSILRKQGKEGEVPTLCAQSDEEEAEGSGNISGDEGYIPLGGRNVVIVTMLAGLVLATIMSRLNRS